MRSIKTNITNERYETDELCLIFEKGGNTLKKGEGNFVENATFRFSKLESLVVEVSLTYVQKYRSL